MNLKAKLALGAGAVALTAASLTGCSTGQATAQYEQVCINPGSLVVYALTGACPWTPYYVPYGYFYAHPAYFAVGHHTTTVIIHSAGASTARPKSGTVYQGTGRNQTASTVKNGKVGPAKTVKTGSGGLVKPASGTKFSGGSKSRSGTGKSGSGTSRKSSFSGSSRRSR